MSILDKIEPIYIENLERDIISEISKLKSISYEEAMVIYFDSKISKLIDEKVNGIQYLDYKYLANEIIEKQ